MNLSALSLAYIRARPVQSAINVVLVALGVAAIVVLLLFQAQIEQRLTRDIWGIDLVVGAKGSPIQLVLSTIYHLDVPTGNIATADADRLRAEAGVETAIPLALGDSIGGFRIVGSDPQIVEHYGATFADGRLWQAPLEAVIGAEVAAKTGLTIGASVVGSHGMASGGQMHGEHPYTIVGILEPTGLVVDRTILTDVATVWRVHEPPASAEGSGQGAAAYKPSDEVTALLLRTASAEITEALKASVNASPRMLAVEPASEAARLLAMLGVGVSAFQTFAYALVASGMLVMFVALFSALDRRRYDIAIMRAVGGGKSAMLLQVINEGVLLCAAGVLCGLVLGHAGAELAGRWLGKEQDLALTGLMFLPSEIVVVIAVIALGIVAAMLPALRAYRMDVATILLRG